MIKLGFPPEPESIEDEPGCSLCSTNPAAPGLAGPGGGKPPPIVCNIMPCDYVVSGSDAEVKRPQEVEALASAVGGRRGRRQSAPSRQFLRRLEQATRDFS